MDLPQYIKNEFILRIFLCELNNRTFLLVTLPSPSFYIITELGLDYHYNKKESALLYSPFYEAILCLTLT